MVLGPNEIKLSQSYIFDNVSDALDKQLRVTGQHKASVSWDIELAFGLTVLNNSIELAEMLESAYKAVGWSDVDVKITEYTSEYGSSVTVTLKLFTSPKPPPPITLLDKLKRLWNS